MKKYLFIFFIFFINFLYFYNTLRNDTSIVFLSDVEEIDTQNYNVNKFLINSDEHSSLETNYQDIDKNKNEVQNKNILININTAPKDVLISIPGIGETIATNIINYRQNNGLFKSIEEIKNVKGIGDKTFEKIKDFISI